MPAPTYITVALPTPLRRQFDYLLPEECRDRTSESLIGARVEAPFSGRTLIGIITDSKDSSDFDSRKIKAALRVIDDQPLLQAETLHLCQWAANYYLHPIGEVLNAALPVALRQGDAATLEPTDLWTLTESNTGDATEKLKRAPKQAKLFDTLKQQRSWRGSDLRNAGIGAAQLKPLIEKQLLSHRHCYPEPNRRDPLLSEPHLTLSTEQHRALDAVNIEAFTIQLLFGDTGSGKTEVYLQALEKVLKNNRQALILVPEIGLTPQTIARFQARFDRTVAVLHSNLNDTERKQAWLLAREGIADIIIGTRSAVFTPMKNPGLIIIDEEHDASLKQQDGFRYHARDLAAVRAKRLNIPLILGSATPSLESLHNVSQGRFAAARLRQRAGNATKPATEIIDLRNQALQDGLTTDLLQQIETTLSAGQQALVFINRRGFAPSLICHNCGWLAQCPRCDARLTVHQSPAHLHCHHCDLQRPITNRCPTCHGHELHCVGQGTERTEHTLSQHFPDTPVIRVDRDSTRTKNGIQDILSQVQTGQPCIIVGTQMLAKGHHFPNVTLVAILDADSGLFSTDFRGIERFGQLLLQVSGRAGRADLPGKVVIQTHLSNHPLLLTLVEQGYEHFAQLIQQERQLANLPPFRPMALLRAESKRADNAIELLESCHHLLRRLLQHNPEASFLGPLPAPMEKRNERFRFQLQLYCNNRAQRHQLCVQLIEHLDAMALSRRVRWSLDIDPQDMS